MALTRTINCDGILQSKQSKTNVHVFYSYSQDSSVNSINFDFTYTPDAKSGNVINVSGNYSIEKKELQTYNVGGGLLDGSILADVKDSVLAPVAKAPETFTDLDSSVPDASVPDSSAPDSSAPDTSAE